MRTAPLSKETRDRLRAIADAITARRLQARLDLDFKTFSKAMLGYDLREATRFLVEARLKELEAERGRTSHPAPAGG